MLASRTSSRQQAASGAGRLGRRPAGWEQLRPLGRASKATRWRTGGKIAGDTRGGKKRAKKGKKKRMLL